MPVTEQASSFTRSVRLANWRVPGLHHTLDAFIDDKGELVIDGCDLGPSVERMWDDLDYEFAWHIPREWKDTILLRLLKDRFEAQPSWREHETAFIEWVKALGVPTKFWCWI
jgi:hypothetical protein